MLFTLGCLLTKKVSAIHKSTFTAIKKYFSEVVVIEQFEMNNEIDELLKVMKDLGDSL